MPWGREHWERLAEGIMFDGMESWLPWLATDERILTDLVPAGSRIVLVEPRRMRDRAHDLLAEEDDLARALATTWNRGADQPTRVRSTSADQSPTRRSMFVVSRRSSIVRWSRVGPG